MHGIATHILCYTSNIEHMFSSKELAMDEISKWTDQLMDAEQKLAEAYEMLAKLQADLKTAGRKKDMQAIGEVVERLGRYGRLFEDIRQSWAEVE